MWKIFKSTWKNIFNYSGKSSRKEFWLGSIANIIAMYVVVAPFALLCRVLLIPFPFAITAYIIIFTLPLLSLYVRRANDAGFRKPDIVFIAVALPIVGALIVGAVCHVIPCTKGLAIVYRCLALGFGLYIYSSFIGTLLLGSFAAVLPIVSVALVLILVSMCAGAVIVKINEIKNNSK